MVTQHNIAVPTLTMMGSIGPSNLDAVKAGTSLPARIFGFVTAVIMTRSKRANLFLLKMVPSMTSRRRGLSRESGARGSKSTASNDTCVAKQSPNIFTSVRRVNSHPWRPIATKRNDSDLLINVLFCYIFPGPSASFSSTPLRINSEASANRVE